MDIRQAFARALKKARKARGRTQEDFAIVSSRTYVSALERGLKSPTLEKIQALAETMGVHSLTLLALAYTEMGEGDERSLDALLASVGAEAREILSRSQSD